MSPRVFDGWAPSEVHEHYDAEGNLTGRTVVTPEPLWDETDRERALELEAAESSRCPDCNLPLAECLDSNRSYNVEEVTCYATRAVELHKRGLAEKAETLKWPEDWSDGKSWIATHSVPNDPKSK